LDVRNPPKINGQPVPTKEPEPAEPPITDEEHAARLLEIRRWQHRMMVLACARLPIESLALFSIDQPGMVAATRRENEKRSAQMILNVPDELVVNFTGDPTKRDLVLLLHLDYETLRVLEKIDSPLLVLPDSRDRF
jgi:hypothetical protein